MGGRYNPTKQSKQNKTTKQNERMQRGRGGIKTIGVRLATERMLLRRAREGKSFKAARLAGLGLFLRQRKLCLLTKLLQLMLEEQVQGDLCLQAWSRSPLSCRGVSARRSQLPDLAGSWLPALTAHLPRCVRPSNHYPLPSGCVHKIDPALSSLKLASVLIV